VAIVAAPRLCLALYSRERPMPLGGDAWKTSRLMLPPSMHELVFRNVITGEEVRATRANDHAWLFVGELFEHLPVAMLTAG
jgi:maltooligosyltrehalose synthase